MLTFEAIIMERFDVRSDAARRRKVTRVTAEYRDVAGDIYRKSFESAPDTLPDVPRSAKNHTELNAKKYQF
jgi:hypothetical protein